MPSSSRAAVNWRLRLAAPRSSAHPSAAWKTSFLFSRRFFYSGLDESRVHRLRRSGMTFNKPRGRDTLSLAFESRIRVLPLIHASDLYGPVDSSLLAAPTKATDEGMSSAVHPRDPTGSEGNPLELKKYHQGDARFQKVLEEKRKQERMVRTKDEWNVLVVDPIPLESRDWPVAYPAMHPLFYADWDSYRDGSRRHRPVLERKRVPIGGAKNLLESNDDCQAALDSAPVEELEMSFLTNNNRRHLQQNGDTTSFSKRLSTVFRVPDLHNGASADNGRAAAFRDRSITQHFHLAACVDPFIDIERFRREEAQVEMISAYRNILYEATEATTTPTRPGVHPQGPVVDVVRVPALCCYTCGPRFLHDIGKLNQQSLIKGFHRLSNEAKELLIMNKAFTVEIYVPPHLLPHFEAAFLEDAWPTPETTLNPGRTALYPSLPPPRSLLDYDGWVGKRPELIEAVETEGKSLLRGPKYNLDGSEIVEQEVFAQVRVFGARTDETKMLEGERKNAAEQLGTDSDRRYDPLRAGLQKEPEAAEPK